MATRQDVLRLRVDVDAKKGSAELDRFSSRAKASATQATRGFDDMTAAVRKFTAVGIGIAAVGLTIDRFAERARDIDGISRAFDTLTARIGVDSGGGLRNLRSASRGLVSDLDLMRQANQAIQLGIPLTTKSMGEMVDIAVTLGRALGQDAASAIESFVTGLGRQSRLMLDNLGIVIDTNAAYEKYADALGVTVSQLDDYQKKQAFVDEGIRLGREKVQGMSDRVLTLADAWTQAKTNMTNFFDAFVNALNTLPTAREAVVVGQFFGQGDGDQGPRGQKLDPQTLQSIREQFFGFATPVDENPLRDALNSFAPLNEFGFAAGDISGPGAFGEGISNLFEVFETKSPSAIAALNELNLEVFNLGEGLNILDEASIQSESTLSALGSAADLIASGFAQAGAAMLGAALSGESTHGMFKSVMRTLAQAAAAQALYETAIGIAALTPWGAALYGPAPLHFKSAATFAAVGAAAAVVGGGSSGSGGGGAGSGVSSSLPVGAALAPPQRSTNVTVFVEGQGFVQDLDGFARNVGAAIEQQNQRIGN